MEIREPGEVFFDTLLIAPSDVSEIEENHDIPDEKGFEDDGSHFTTETVEDITATDIYGNLAGPPIDEDAAELEIQIDEPTHNPRNPPPEIAIPADASGTVTQQILQPNNSQEPTPSSPSPNGTIPKSRSLTHYKFEAKKVVFVSLTSKLEDNNNSNSNNNNTNNINISNSNMPAIEIAAMTVLINYNCCNLCYYNCNY